MINTNSLYFFLGQIEGILEMEKRKVVKAEEVVVEIRKCVEEVKKELG